LASVFERQQNVKQLEQHSLKNKNKQLLNGSEPTPSGSAIPSHRIGWSWLLVTAPGRLLTVHSPLSTTEVERLLRQQVANVVSPKPHQVVIRLPTARTERRFFAWVEPNPNSPGSSRLIGQTRTPARVALVRAGISLILFWLALFWFSSAHTWLGGLFAIGCAGFLLLAQYERLTERDRRLYVIWLRKVIEAEPVDNTKTR